MYECKKCSSSSSALINYREMATSVLLLDISLRNGRPDQEKKHFRLAGASPTDNIYKYKMYMLNNCIFRCTSIYNLHLCIQLENGVA